MSVQRADTAGVTDARCPLGAQHDIRNTADAVTDARCQAASQHDIRNAARREFERRAAVATAELAARIEQFDVRAARGEPTFWDRFVGRPRMRTIEAEEIAQEDAARVAQACWRCFAPLEALWFFSRSNRKKQLPTCADCFEDVRREIVAEICKFQHVTAEELDRIYWPSPSRVWTSECAACGRTMHFGWWHRGLRTCCTECDRVTDLVQRRARRAAIRNGTVCAECGTTFDPPRAGAKFCTPACRQKNYRRRRAGTAER